MVISTILPSSLMILAPPSVPTAIVGIGSPVASSIGALGSTVIATSLQVDATRTSVVLMVT